MEPCLAAGVPETMMQKLSQKEEEAIIRRRSWTQETELHQEQTHRSEYRINFLFKHHRWGSVYLPPANPLTVSAQWIFFKLFNAHKWWDHYHFVDSRCNRGALFPSPVKSFFLSLLRAYEALAGVTDPAPSNADHSSDPKLCLLFSCSVVSDSSQPRGLQPARLVCPPLPPRVCSKLISD